MSYLLFLDLETTSTLVSEAQPWEIGGEIWRGNELQEKFTYRVRPSKDKFPNTDWRGACVFAGIREEEMFKAPSPEEVWRSLRSILNLYIDPSSSHRFTLAGWNISAYDEPIFRSWLLRATRQSFLMGQYFWHPPIDVMSLAAQDLLSTGHRHNLTDFRLESVLDHYEILYDRSKLHTALYDAQLTAKLYFHLTREVAQGPVRKW